MTSALRVSRSTRRWSLIAALPLAAVALVACGGKVVVDADTSAGTGGANTSSASANPSSGSTGLNTCDAAIAHLEVCVPGSTTMVPPIPICSGMVLCQFSCILAAPCGAFNGTDMASATVFANCVTACG